MNARALLPWPLVVVSIVAALGASPPLAGAGERAASYAPRHADGGDPGPAPRSVRSGDSKTVDLLLDDAEAAYRGGRWSVANDAFKAVLSMAPDHPQAWFRVGNLHHRRSQWLPAASAYRKSADRADGDPAHAGVRVRALLNLAAVNLELANQALSQAQSEGAPDGGPVDRDAIERDLLQQLHRVRERHGDAVGAPKSSGVAPPEPRGSGASFPPAAPSGPKADAPGLRGAAMQAPGSHAPPVGALASPAVERSAARAMRPSPATETAWAHEAPNAAAPATPSATPPAQPPARASTSPAGAEHSTARFGPTIEYLRGAPRP